MRYRIKQITVSDKDGGGRIDLPDGALVIEAKSSTTSVSHGEDYEVWSIRYLEPLESSKGLQGCDD